MNDILKRKLKDSFSRFLFENQAPKYFIEAKLILLSNNGSEFPTIGKIRPNKRSPKYKKCVWVKYYKWNQ